jgi:hypothetical protein
MVKYCCDDCEREVNMADALRQLDMTNHVYCSECYPKHENERKSAIYSLSWDQIHNK